MRMSHSRRNPGRVAGALYLLLVAIAPFRLVYVPNTLFVRGNATATADNILAHQLLFRLGIVSELACGIVLVFVVLALYRLLKAVDHDQALLMVILGGLMPATIDFLVVANDAAALMLVRGDDALAVIEKPQRDALAFLFVRLHHQVVLDRPRHQRRPPIRRATSRHLRCTFKTLTCSPSIRPSVI